MTDLNATVQRIGIFLGAMRCGSTAIRDYMKQHPEVCLHEKKDPHFFSSDENWRQGWAYYLEGWKHYNPAKHSVAFDSSTHYTKYPLYPRAAERMASTIRDVRLIYGVRDPVARVESHLIHNVGKGYLDCQDVSARSRLIDQATNVSNYELQIDQYEKYFPPGNIEIMDLTRLRNDPDEVMKQIFAYLGLDEDVTIERIAPRPRKFKQGISGVSLSREEKSQIENCLYEPIKRFESRYGVRVWKTESSEE